MDQVKLARDVRLLKAYASVATIALLTILLTAFQAGQKQKFAEIDVERINIVEPDGKLDLVISNGKRFPPPVLSGRLMKRSGEVGRGIPGMVFYNGNGDEQGGLAWSSRLEDGKYTAGGLLAFDQYNHDQTVALSYEDVNGQRSAGMKVWDHPNGSLADLYDRSEEVKKMKPGPERDAAMKRLGEEWGAQRLFVGKLADKSAVLTLADTDGKTRIKIAVDSGGNPSLVLLDKDGKATYSLPPAK